MSCSSSNCWYVMQNNFDHIDGQSESPRVNENVEVFLNGYIEHDDEFEDPIIEFAKDPIIYPPEFGKK